MPGSPVSAGRYLLGDASYGARRKGAMYGDPGLAGLLAGPLLSVGKKLVGSVFKKAPAVVAPTVVKAPGIASGAIQTIKRVAGPIGAIAAGTAAGNLATQELSLQIGGGGPRRYRRMNPLNPKALKRATRRLAGFHTFAQNTEKELRKLAPQKRSCAPRRKACR